MGFTIVPRMSITWSQALAWVRQRQLLEPVGRESVADVVRRLGAVLAVDDSAAELAVRMRRAHSRAGEVVRALEDGRLIQAFALRGAMPYLSPEDGGAHLALRSAVASGSSRAGRSTTSWGRVTGRRSVRRSARHLRTVR